MSFILKNDADGELLFKKDFSSTDNTTIGYSSNVFNFDFPFGKIHTNEWFFGGVYLLYLVSEFDNPITLGWKSDTEMVTMYFNLQGRFSIIDARNKKTIELSANQHNMFYGFETEGKVKVDELKMKSFMIQFTKEAFLRIANNGNDAIKRFANEVSEGKTTFFSNHNLNIDFAIQNCINKVLQCSYSEPLKKMYLFSKAIEMLVLQAESYDKTLNRGKKILKTEYDNERILFARDYLLKNIDYPPTLSELSRIVGINEFKLKRGFKEIFNQSVFQYLSDVRLELAKTDLLEGTKSATEIAFELGYSSIQHFSAAFKKKFGTPPSKVK